MGTRVGVPALGGYRLSTRTGRRLGASAPGQESDEASGRLCGWDGERALRPGAPLCDRDLRVIARMRFTGVPYSDIAYIFDITWLDARLLVWRYARTALGDEVSQGPPVAG